MSRRGERARVTDEDLSRATDTIERWYRQWVQDTANDLFLDFMRGEIEDRDSFQERSDEVTDSAMIYNVDQSRTLFASNSVDEAAEEMQDTGGGGDNSQAVLAVLTFRIDVRGALPSEFSEVEDMDPFERLQWLAEEKGTVLLDSVYFVGEVDGIDYGVLMLDVEAEEGKLESVRNIVRHGKDREAANLVIRHLQQIGPPELLVDIDKWLIERGE